MRRVLSIIIIAFLSAGLLLAQGCARERRASLSAAADLTAAARYLASPGPARGFISHRRAPTWEQGLVSGNGTMGALVMGDALAETITLSRAGLFMPLNEPLQPPSQGLHLLELRELLAAGHYQQAADKIVALANAEDYGGKRWTDPFIPAFDLQILTPECGAIEDYRRGVDFQTGVASVGWRDGRGPMLRRLFVSRADNLVVLSLSGVKKGAVDCQIALAQHPRDRMGRAGVLDAKAGASGGWLSYRGGFKRRWPGSLQGYEGVARVITKGGTTFAASGRMEVHGADEVMILLRIELIPDFGWTKILRLRAALETYPHDFVTLLAAHAKVHGEIFNRARLDLGGSRADRRLASEDLLAKSKVGALNPALLEREFDAARYAILSSSGEQFPLLQGIWTGTYNPRWSGDYTMNGNVQCALAANLSGNMAELMEPYFNYLEAQLPDYRENAKRLFRCRGIHVPSRASSHGLNNHFDATWPMTFWTAGAAWAAHFYYDYYLYTGDREFLRTRALPFMKEAALFYEDFLTTSSADGKLLFSPSYSPENNPGNSPSQACVNATMDIAAARELLTNIVAACDELTTEPEHLQTWRAMLQKLPPYAINDDGAVKEYTWPTLADNYAHRHGSHFYALFDGLPPEIADNPGLQAAFKRAAELRLAVRRQENGGIMAFGLVQLGQAMISLRQAPFAYESLDWLANNFWAPNMVTTHNPGAVFNVDLCGGLPALVIRMLLESRADPGRPVELELLPALPVQWPSGRIEGVRARGQIAVESLAWRGRVVEAALKSEIEQTVRITVPGGIKTLKFSPRGLGNNFAKDGSCALTLPAGVSVKVKLWKK